LSTPCAAAAHADQAPADGTQTGIAFVGRLRDAEKKGYPDFLVDWLIS
jgi:hypothetical protein